MSTLAYLRLFVAICLTCGFAVGVQANPMRLDASFSGSPVNANGDPLPKPPPFAGTLTYLYDSDSIPLTGGYTVDWVNPTTITFTAPHPGSKVFDASNTRISMFFLNSEPLLLTLGDDITPSSVSVGGYDDFFVFIYPSSPYPNVQSALYYTLASDFWFFAKDTHISATLSATPVGVPDSGSTTSLIVIGMVAIQFCRKPRRMS